MIDDFKPGGFIVSMESRGNYGIILFFAYG
jgi:hypothetical protein